MKYTGEKLTEISFPLGGIGTGCIGLGGDGRLVDWEIFNRPNKGSINSYSFFAVRAIQGDKITAAVLNGDALKEHMGSYAKQGHFGYGHGADKKKMYGFPHFKNVEFHGEFPISNIRFHDELFPANVNMTAFNPFIPRDAKNSSIPAAFFEVEVQNTTSENIKYQVAFAIANANRESINEASKKDGFTLINLHGAIEEKDSTEYRELTVATDSKRAYVQPYWYRGRWFDNIVTFWNEFSKEKEIKNRTYDTHGKWDNATLVAEIDVPAYEKRRVRFILSWNCPNNFNYWDNSEDDSIRKPWKNYYATVFENSKESACYSLSNWDDLYNRTLNFKNALHETTLPPEVIDAASANLSVLKSPTVLRFEDGSFYGWEGVNMHDGSCEGTCQHVWNYAYAMCFLFPELERSIRENEFSYCTAPDGRMAFRIPLPLGRDIPPYRACVDGQMGTVIKCYREWKISGDNNWLRANWENIKKILEYAWNPENFDRWDYDRDGVLEGRQHHTLDMEMFGPSSWLQGFYLAALKAASEMGEFLGDTEKAEEYRSIYEKGRKWTKENLFNGSHFIQKIDVTDKSIVDKFNASEDYWNYEKKEIKYQIAEGSSIDQLLGQWHADIVGLGDLFDKEQIETALSNLMKNNFKPSMRYFANPWRVFSADDEAGTVICDYPDGTKKPAIPIPYCEETMTGFEYAFAGLLCSRGKTNDGLKVVKAIRDRYDGKKRNPWNEIECGNNYARSMSSYALIPILSGFEFDMPHGHIGFNPVNHADFKCVWSLDSAWGVFEICGNTARINIHEGSLKIKSLGVKFCDKVTSVNIDGENIIFSFENGKIYFDETNISECVEISI
ncbi:MAG: hypothetical protein E7406_09325 [Ruminococcaceae bacterium]|nr:hypothetical protein [Oscillospiraceae bacterium]